MAPIASDAEAARSLRYGDLASRTAACPLATDGGQECSIGSEVELL